MRQEARYLLPFCSRCTWSKSWKQRRASWHRRQSAGSSCTPSACSRGSWTSSRRWPWNKKDIYYILQRFPCNYFWRVQNSRVIIFNVYRSSFHCAKIPYNYTRNMWRVCRRIGSHNSIANKLISLFLNFKNIHHCFEFYEILK